MDPKVHQMTHLHITTLLWCDRLNILKNSKPWTPRSKYCVSYSASVGIVAVGGPLSMVSTSDKNSGPTADTE